MATRPISARVVHVQNILQKGSDSGAVIGDGSLGTPETTVNWSGNSVANAVVPPQREHAAVDHLPTREENVMTDRIVKKAEERNPSHIAKELQKEKIVSADATLVKTRKTTSGVSATKKTGNSRGRFTRSDPRVKLR
ncbi:hypothetical protein BWQ96_01098 [Gracilariopsis chorda]|uniref:Uncharacterized protein n=1 Tax=Gracilariopsis chorda TaxID=448386 RepID=A0A2V3J442_9FLOR|nr:hypothetical protein BWQ96_01098 [Gracilariopsis chorda]|eukprot:PXF49149.1 hypothetical protein BWQ96_01098 [Gracilariopsis chorda]